MNARVALRFRVGAFVAEETVTVTVVDAVTPGFDILEAAVHVLYYELPQWQVPVLENGVVARHEQVPYLTLRDHTDANRIHYFEDTDQRGPEWLKEFVVKAELLEFLNLEGRRK
jgi:hypothetical protein